ncbi:alpha/beta hydrolase family esterase [Plantactinospora mayteni]|nr:PHB depolymerase family esterase [Plantactinospora mayteni]
MSVLLATAVLTPGIAHAGPPAQPEPPEVRTLETTVPAYDPMRGIRMGVSGLFERTVAGTGGRTAKIYASKDAYLGSYIVVLNTPEGEETVSWLAKSGWIERADKEKLVLYVLEPGASGEWGTAAEEQSYIETAYTNIGANGVDGRGDWYQPSESYYVVGYDTAGSVLQKLVMDDPILVAAAAFVDASDIDTQYLASMNSNFYPTPDWNGDLVASADVPVPVWIINSRQSQASDDVIDYWKDANQTSSKGTGFEGGKIFEQKPNMLYGYVAETSRVAVGVLEKKNIRENEPKERQLDKKIYDFLSSYTRYGGNVGGNTIGSRQDLDELGVTYQTMVVDGRLREYLVYVPHKAKVAAARGKDVPLVFSLHGSGMTMYMMFDYSRWWEVADREGFILVHPTSTNNGRATSWATAPTSSDHTFFGLLLDELKTNYNVDESRVYIGGQSNGAAMSQAVGRNLALSQNFTAVGATSFPSTSTNYDGETLPYYMAMGEFDFWPYQPSTPPVGGMISYWINRNDALGTPTTAASEEMSGRFVTSKWNNEDGVNVVRYTVTKGRGHSIIPEEMELIWDWYELWQKDAEGNNVYVGP